MVIITQLIWAFVVFDKADKTLYNLILLNSETYPRGRRGAPAKGVGRVIPSREFKSLCLRTKKESFNKDSFYFLYFLISCKQSLNTAARSKSRLSAAPLIIFSSSRITLFSSF